MITEPALSHVRVHDVMHTGLLLTDAGTSLRVVANLMAEQHVHAVAVSDPHYARRPIGLVTALDIAVAITEGEGGAQTAGEAASTDFLTIPATDSLTDAAYLMATNKLNHLIVIDPATGHPSGILSSLDLASAYAA